MGPGAFSEDYKPQKGTANRSYKRFKFCKIIVISFIHKYSNLSYDFVMLFLLAVNTHKHLIKSPNSSYILLDISNVNLIISYLRLTLYVLTVFANTNSF